jgi:hypothetical protein
VADLRRHFLCTHGPWFLAPETACFLCHAQFADSGTVERHVLLSQCGEAGRWDHTERSFWRARAAQLLRALALGEGKSLKALVQMFENIRPRPGSSHGARILAEDPLLGSPDVRCWPPNCPAGLLHWSTVYKLMIRMDEVHTRRLLAHGHVTWPLDSYPPGAIRPDVHGPLCRRVWE